MPKVSTSLFIKFTIPILLLFSGIFFSLGITYWYAQKNDNQRNALLLGETILGNLVHLIQLQGINSDWLQPYIVGVGAGPGIIEICVCNSEGLVQTGTLSAKKGQPCRVESTDLNAQNRSSRVTSHFTRDQNILHITQPIPSIHPQDPPLAWSA